MIIKEEKVIPGIGIGKFILGMDKKEVLGILFRNSESFLILLEKDDKVNE